MKIVAVAFFVVFFIVITSSCIYNNKEKLEFGLQTMGVQLKHKYIITSVTTYPEPNEDLNLKFKVSESDKRNVLDSLKKRFSFNKSDVTDLIDITGDTGYYGIVYKTQYILKFQKNKINSSHGDLIIFQIDSLSNNCEYDYFDY